MVLVVDKKFLEDDWWKYALALGLLQVLFWVLLGYKLNPDFTAIKGLSGSRVVVGAFLFTAFLPFIAGRLQLRKLFWFGFVGYLLALAGYYALSLLKVGERFNLLPFIAFLQVYVTCFGLGALVEFGRYVLDKLAE